MSIALNLFYFAVPLMMFFSVVLSVSTGVGGCWWPIYARSVLMDVAFCQYSISPPNYASVANSITFLIMLHYKCTGPNTGGIVCIGVWYFFPREKYPPALLRASGSDM